MSKIEYEIRAAFEYRESEAKRRALRRVIRTEIAAQLKNNLRSLKK